ncbi:hypothetical protein PVK06_042041 [Gossypium arboreum]|uniref:Uncharacterized protein n=1 Tax=Gossypium arboreum TaxID=29729 RepID=A0ABR0N9W9_GOSAR|nr:hypothetical protein PVK06_042041 [Gossypium arboreum]
MDLPFSIPYHCSPILLPLPRHPFDLRCQKVLFPNRCFDSKNRKSSLTIKEQDEEQELERTAKIEESNIAVGIGLEDIGGSSSEILVDGKLFPDLPGVQPDLWKGPKWDVLGFLV